MDGDTPVHRLAARRQRIVGAEPGQGGHPRSRVGGPALHGVRGRRDLETVASAGNVPHRVGRGRTGREGARDAVADTAGAPGAAGGGPNAARAEIALPWVWWRIAARTVAHGFMLVTGLSEPKASGHALGC